MYAQLLLTIGEFVCISSAEHECISVYSVSLQGCAGVPLYTALISVSGSIAGCMLIEVVCVECMLIAMWDVNISVHKCRW